MKVLEGNGLALSGGGFRASLFHLGVTRRLHELGVLQKITRLSTVSGGSIFAGFLANQLIEKDRVTLHFDDWHKEVSGPFKKFVRKDMRTGLILGHIGWNWLNPGPRAKGYERSLRKRLTKRKLIELPDAEDNLNVVEFVFLATSLKYGTAWRFEPRRMLTWRGKKGKGYEVGDTRISTAVAASACFPPIFGPIVIDLPDGEKAYLTDGGVYDNTGMEPVWDENKLVLVSDCGSPFSDVVPKWYGSRLMRYIAIGQNQVGAQRRRALIGRLDDDYETVRVFAPDDPKLDKEPPDCKRSAEPNCFMSNRRSTDNPRGAYWRLESRKANFLGNGDQTFKDDVARLEKDWYGYSPDIQDQIAHIRTDLDSFTEAESCILENHGYYMADIAVRCHARGDADFDAEFKVPNRKYIDEAVVKKALKHSASKLWFWKRWFDKG